MAPRIITAPSIKFRMAILPKPSGIITRIFSPRICRQNCHSEFYARRCIFKLIGLLPLLCQLSCIEAPVELLLDKKLELSEAKVKEISDNILDEIKSIEPAQFGSIAGAPNTVDPEDCKKAFNDWITEEFKKGYVPKRKVSYQEYAAKSTAPYKDQCLPIDIEEEFIKSKNEADRKSTSKDSILFNLPKLREAFSKGGPCALNFIAPEKRKLTINAMNMRVDTNTLNVTSPTYNIYYSTSSVTEEQLNESGAEQKLKDAGIIKPYAQTAPIPAGFIGIMPFKIIEDQRALRAAKEKIETFDTELIAIPSKMDREFESKTINGEDFFVVPKGMLVSRVGIDISLKAEVGDAICALQKYKRESNEQKE